MVAGRVLTKVKALPLGRAGVSVVIFDNEQSARFASDNMSPPAGVRMVSSQVREVVASA